MSDWLAAAFFEPIIEERRRRVADPGTPAYPRMPDGRPTPALTDGAPIPVSFVAAALERYPVLINLDQLRRSVHAALEGKPDTRTPQQRSRDDWAAYLRAKERYEGTKASAQEEDGAGSAQEQAPRPAEEGAAPGAQGPDRDHQAPGD